MAAFMPQWQRCATIIKTVWSPKPGTVGCLAVYKRLLTRYQKLLVLGLWFFDGSPAEKNISFYLWFAICLRVSCTHMFWSGASSSHFCLFSITTPPWYFFPLSCSLPLNRSPLSACMCPEAGSYTGALGPLRDCILEENWLCLPQHPSVANSSSQGWDSVSPFPTHAGVQATSILCV